MQDVYPLLDEAEMIVLASPVYYHGFSGQLQCAINRIYALDKPKKLKKAALILSSGSDHVYSGAIYEYQNSFLNYLRLEDMGIYTAYDQQKPISGEAGGALSIWQKSGTGRTGGSRSHACPRLPNGLRRRGAGAPGLGGHGRFRLVLPGRPCGSPQS